MPAAVTARSTRAIASVTGNALAIVRRPVATASPPGAGGPACTPDHSGGSLAGNDSSFVSSTASWGLSGVVMVWPSSRGSVPAGIAAGSARSRAGRRALALDGAGEVAAVLPAVASAADDATDRRGGRSDAEPERRESAALGAARAVARPGRRLARLGGLGRRVRPLGAAVVVGRADPVRVRRLALGPGAAAGRRALAAVGVRRRARVAVARPRVARVRARRAVALRGAGLGVAAVAAGAAARG